MTTIKKFNKIFGETSKNYLCMGSKQSLIKKAKIILNEQNIPLNYLDKQISKRGIILVWSGAFGQNVSIKSLTKSSSELYGDKINFLNVDRFGVNYEISKKITGPITVKILLREMDKLGNNFHECGFFRYLTRVKTGVYVIGWNR